MRENISFLYKLRERHPLDLIQLNDLWDCEPFWKSDLPWPDWRAETALILFDTVTMDQPVMIDCEDTFLIHYQHSLQSLALFDICSPVKSVSGRYYTLNFSVDFLSPLKGFVLFKEDYHRNCKSVLVFFRTNDET